MSGHPSKPTELVEADQALEDLLGTLLADVPEHRDAPPVAPPAPAQPEVVTETAGETQVQVQPEVPVEAVVEQALNIREDAPIQEQDEQPSAEPLQRPEWAGSEIKVLVVRVGDLRLGVPLVCLNSIAPMPQDTAVTQVPAQPDWHRGVMQHRDSKLVIVDLPDLLQLRSGERQPGYLLVIGDGHYGLACDALEEPVTVSADALNWRQADDRRNWMWGMLPEHMCLLLDVDGIAQRAGG